MEQVIVTTAVGLLSGAGGILLKISMDKLMQSNGKKENNNNNGNASKEDARFIAIDEIAKHSAACNQIFKRIDQTLNEGNVRFDKIDNMMHVFDNKMDVYAKNINDKIANIDSRITKVENITKIS